MFLGANCLSICLSVCFWCLDYSRINEQIFIKKCLWIGPGQKKKLLKERSGSYFGYKKIKNFQRSHFNVFLMNLAFYLIFLRKLIYMFGFILLSFYNTLYHFTDWSHGIEHFALSECILFYLVYHSKGIHKIFC